MDLPQPQVHSSQVSTSATVTAGLEAFQEQEQEQGQPNDIRLEQKPECQSGSYDTDHVHIVEWFAPQTGINATEEQPWDVGNSTTTDEQDKEIDRELLQLQQ